jgi:plastocyanin
MTKTNGMILFAVLVVVGLIAWQLTTHSAPQPAAPTAAVEGVTSITLTPDGFVPAEITITKGQTVTWTTTTGKAFWPASNPHPSHTNYSGFDPERPVAADGSWNFTFDTVGTWGYHDHLAPYFTGTIHVTE